MIENFLIWIFPLNFIHFFHILYRARKLWWKRKPRTEQNILCIQECNKHKFLADIIILGKCWNRVYNRKAFKLRRYRKMNWLKSGKRLLISWNIPNRWYSSFTRLRHSHMSDGVYLCESTNRLPFEMKPKKNIFMIKIFSSCACRIAVYLNDREKQKPLTPHSI